MYLIYAATDDSAGMAIANSDISVWKFPVIFVASDKYLDKFVRVIRRYKMMSKPVNKYIHSC